MIPPIPSVEDLNIFAVTLIGEARGEPIEGIVGCANVIRNRVNIKMRGTTYSEVCLSRAQFSCWGKHDKNYSLMVELLEHLRSGKKFSTQSYRQCFAVARAVMDGDFKDNTKGSTHYLEGSLYRSDECPMWAKQGDAKVKLGHHVFLVAK